MHFDWDENKARLNLTNHDISFDEAKTIFDDPLYVDFFDPDHSDSENRYLRFGMSDQHRLLLVSHTERGDTLRIISARLATKNERKTYEQA